MTKGVGNALQSALNVANAIILAYASWTIRKTIKAQSNVMPNQHLISVHITNSVIFAVLFTVESTIKEIALKALREEDLHITPPIMLRVEKIEFSYWVVIIITLAFTLYMDLFLIILIVRFTRES